MARGCLALFPLSRGGEVNQIENIIVPAPVH